MGSAARSTSARPYPPATAFDFQPRLARGRARAARGGKCWRFYAALFGAEHDRAAVEKALAIENFIHPRALWWAFDWTGAEKQATRAKAPLPPQPAGCNHTDGVVVLIDEIDKADAEVPNGLLEALGAGQFTPQGALTPVRATNPDIPPLVMITTNEERSLPDAFVRRCLVLHLRLPTERQELIDRLVLHA